MSELLLCYNKCCPIKKYKEEENSDEACIYHPGDPIFHDVLKGWTCCKKRSTDFTDFLNIPGCTKGRHNPVKPTEPLVKPVTPLEKGEVLVVEAPKPKAPIERPSDDLPYVPLKVTVGKSLVTALERLRVQEDKAPKPEAKDDNKTVEVGTKCKNRGCEKVYTGEVEGFQECEYHPGIPIFHEGYKFWTCCQKRTSDWNEFIRQLGCTTGNHVWHETETKDISTSCRYDWHQTGNFVVISIYAKCAVPEDSYFEANPTNLTVTVSFQGGKKVFAKAWKLGGVIDVQKSQVEILGTKAEIKLRKADGQGWKHLDYKESEGTN